MLNHLKRLSFRVMITLFVGISALFPQTMSERLLPKGFPYISSADITVDRFNNIHIMGISTQVQTTYPLEDQGSCLIYYTRVENDSIFQTITIPDTGYYYSFGLGGSGDIFKYSQQVLSSASTIIGWSKQYCSWGDIVPNLSFKLPKLHFSEISENTTYSILNIDSAQAPSISLTTKGDLHFFWETDSTDCDSLYGFYNFYKGRISHLIRYNNDSITPIQTIGIGFEPHSTISKEDTFFVVWLHADSSNSEYFQLQYVKGFGTSFSTPVTIYDSIYSWFGIPDYIRKIKVSDDNVLHIGFDANKKGVNYINAIKITPDGQVQIDSTKGWGAKFDFTDSGIEYVVYPFWSTPGGIAFSSSKSDRLFAQNKYYYFTAGTPSSYDLLTTSKDISCLLANDNSNLKYIRDLEHGDDSIHTLKTPAYGVNGSSVVIDFNDNILCTYSKKPATPQQYTYIGYDSVWLLKITDPALSVKESQVQPTDFILYQNYPNPFNPITTIRFDLPKVSSVILKIFNMLGQEISTLVNDNRTAGTYEIQVDGSKMVSGVYFYRITAKSTLGNYNAERKMILIK